MKVDAPNREYYKQLKKKIISLFGTTHNLYYGDPNFQCSSNDKIIGINSTCKPDWIAIKKTKDEIIIGEIKTVSENPARSDYRKKSSENESQVFTGVRTNIKNEEEQGRISKKIGGQVIIIQGQIPEYQRKMKVTWTVPELDTFDYSSVPVKHCYSFPSARNGDVRAAYNRLGKQLTFQGNTSLKFTVQVSHDFIIADA